MKSKEQFIELNAENTCEADICELLDKIGILEANQNHLLKQVKSLTKPVLNLKEASKYLNISPKYLYKLNSKRTIAYNRPNQGKITYKKKDLDNYLMTNKRHSLSELKAGL